VSLDDHLELAIIRINQTYNSLSAEYTGETFNFRKEKVKNLIDENLIIKTSCKIIFNDYRNHLFINQNLLIELNLDLENILFNPNEEVYRINQRIKAPNSINEKILRYCRKKEQGNIPLIKCLNDFYGIRIVFYNLWENKDCIINKLESLKRNKTIRKYYIRNDGSYIGIQVTVNSNDNYRFPWEIQIWDKSNFNKNMISHDSHKEMTEYTNIPDHYFTKIHSKMLEY